MKNNKSIILSVFFIGTVLLSFLLYEISDKNMDVSLDEVVTIGAILPLSGQNEFYGNEIRNAIELAREEINSSGGVVGKRLEIIYEDDQALARFGTNAMQKLVNVDKVPIVLGSWASGSVLASAPIAEKARVVVLASAISPKISDAGDYIFRIQPSATFYTEKLAKKMIQEFDIQTYGVIHINNEFGESLKDAFVEEIQRLDGEVIVVESYPEGNQDFRSQLTKIKIQNPGALFIGSYQEQASVVKQSAEIGLSSRILAGPPFENQSIVDDLGDLSEGVLYPYHFVLSISNRKTQEYAKNYKKRWGVETGGFAPLMYDGVYIVASIIESCGGVEDSECLRDTLYATNYKGVSGDVSFDENGDPLLPIVIKTVRDGQFVEVE